MSIAMTEEQRNDFEEDGFIVLENFLTAEETKRLSDAAEEVVGKIQKEKGMPPETHFQVRNALARHDAFLDLIDHPRMLPLVVDAIGWNIQIRTSHLDYRPPYPEGMKAGDVGVGGGEDQEAGYRNVSWHPDLASPHIFEGPSLDGRLPFMEIKVFYTLFDMTESNCGNLWLSPGSHKRTPQELKDMGRRVPEDESVELKLPAGSAVLWRTATWQPPAGSAVLWRTATWLAWGRTFRRRHARSCTWGITGVGCGRRITSSRIRILWSGARRFGDNFWGRWRHGDPLGEDSDVAPSSQYWQPKNPEDVPLREWAESQQAAALGK